MEGTSSVLYAPEAAGERLWRAAERFFAAFASEPGLLRYADLHGTRHSHKFVLVQMYRNAGARAQGAANKARAGYELRKHEAFTTWPIASVGPFARTFSAGGGVP